LIELVTLLKKQLLFYPMEALTIRGSHGTFFTPAINFSPSGVCEIAGESYLEESFEFYDNLIKWMSKYFEEGNKSIQLSFRLTYFNTSSSRAILDLLTTLKAKKDEGKDITVNWYYPDPDNDEMRMEAEDYIDETGLDINLISYPA
jgi:SiaC family regulatory phosphoprotein